MRVVAAALAMAGISISAVAAGPAVIPTEVRASDERKVKRMRKAVAAGTVTVFRRSRGPQAKPKRKPNMRHVSKRLRRKHRRAA